MVSERLDKIMRKYNLTAAKFAEILEVQPSAISHILSGRNKPSFDFLLRIATKIPEINMEWLITGKGNMTKVVVQQTLFQDSNSSTSNQNNINEGLSERGKDSADKKSGNIAKLSQVTNVNVHKSVKRVIIFYNDNTFETYEPSTSD